MFLANIENDTILRQLLCDPCYLQDMLFGVFAMSALADVDDLRVGVEELKDL